MNITLPLVPPEEAKLMAIAQARGISAEALVREIVAKTLATAPDASLQKKLTISARGILAKYGPAPSAEEIDQNRAEMFANFACD